MSNKPGPTVSTNQQWEGCSAAGGIVLTNYKRAPIEVPVDNLRHWRVGDDAPGTAE